MSILNNTQPTDIVVISIYFEVTASRAALFSFQIYDGITNFAISTHIM